MNNEDYNTFDFLINDEDEVMLLMYAREGEPSKASISFNPSTASAIFIRREGEEIELSEIPAEVLDSIVEADSLLVCELSKEEKDEDTEIVYAYEAEITD